MIVLRQRIYGATVYDAQGVGSSITSTQLAEKYRAAVKNEGFTGTMYDYKTQNYGSLKGSTFGSGIGTVGAAQTEMNKAADTYKANQDILGDLSKGAKTPDDLNALKQLSTENKGTLANTQNQINTTYGTSSTTGVHQNKPISKPPTTSPTSKPGLGSAIKGGFMSGLKGVGYGAVGLTALSAYALHNTTSSVEDKFTYRP